MSTPGGRRELPGGVRIGAYVLGLAVALGGAFGVGKAVGPIELAASPSEDGHGEHGVSTGSTSGEDGSTSGEDGSTAAAADHGVGGLSAASGGYRLELSDRIVDAGHQELSFTVRTPAGHALTDYTEAHEKDLHLILVRRDLSGFQHLHPELDPATGEWSTTADLTAGTWRVVADFTPAGWDPLTLADDLSVAGDFTPVPLPAVRASAEVDGYTVHLAGSTAPGAPTVLTTHVTKDGREVTDLEPYLGAYGHLVAMREGDLGYLHVHPEDGPPGPEVAFATTFPDHGTYRLFLDFKHAGKVRTAEFTVTASGVPDAEGGSNEGGGHDH